MHDADIWRIQENLLQYLLQHLIASFFDGCKDAYWFSFLADHPSLSVDELKH